MGRRVLYILLIALLAPQVIFAAAGPVPAAAVFDPAVRLLVGRSTVVDVGSPIARVSLTSPDIADAMVTSPSQLLVNGKAPGTISMFVWDRGGVLRRYEVTVQRDVDKLSDQVKQLFPGEKIAIESNGRNIVLSGSVSTKDVSEKALSLAGGYVDKKDEVINLMQVAEGGASNQVLLRVRFAEVSRSALTELGASFFTSPTGIKNTIGRVTTQQFPSVGYDELQYTKVPGAVSNGGKFGSDVASASGKFTFSDFLNLFLFNEKYDLGTMIRALQTRGLFESLAEPNLVAESGKQASFLAGGEFPIPIAQPSGGGTAITVVFKEFGIRLNFTPIVNGNRVHLKVRPEVSSLDFNNAIVLQGFRIPALSTRRTETELELEDHQTFAIAGLLNNTMLQSMQKVPGIGDIPILGLLFKSKAAQKNQTELVVMITPEILRTNSPGVTNQLPRLAEPYLPPMTDKKSFPPPPPAFVPPAGILAPTPGAPAAPAVSKPGAPNTDATSAAAAVSALTPRGPQMVTQPEPVAPAPAAQGAQPASAAPATPQATAQAATPAATRPLTSAEKKTLERVRRQEEKQRRAEAEARAIEEKRLAQKKEADDKAAAEQKKRDEKLAKEQAKKDAEAQKRAAEEAKRQAERDKAQQKVIDEAAAKLKAAQAAYEAEIAKKQPKQELKQR